MSKHTSIFTFIAALSLLHTGCACLFSGRGSQDEYLSASQLRSQELFAENEKLNGLNGTQQGMIGGLEAERLAMGQQLAQTENQLAMANSRIDNLLAERTDLKDRYAANLRDTSSDPLMTSAAPDSVAGFQYDDLTGLNKFPEDILFDLGSAELRAESLPVLKDFASQVSSGGVEGMRVLIVGHTDDQRIVKSSTAVRHPTNWHLSTDRADQVILKLQELGIDAERMAAMGYSRFQPLESGTDDQSRQRNRRVELYIVPESTNVAAWDPARALK